MINVTTEASAATAAADPLKRLTDEDVSRRLDGLSRERVSKGVDGE
jgi:transaldolase